MVGAQLFYNALESLPGEHCPQNVQLGVEASTYLTLVTPQHLLPSGPGSPRPHILLPPKISPPLTTPKQEESRCVVAVITLHQLAT